MAPSPGNNRTKRIRGVVLAQSIHADKTLLVSSQQRGYFAAFNLIPGLTQQFQQLLKALGPLCQSFINGIANPFPVRKFLLIPQPFVVGLTLALGISHNGISVLNADGIVQAAYRSGAAPEIAEFALFIQRGGVPDNVIMDVSLINVRTDDVGMVAFCESPCQLAAQAIGFPRRDRAGTERLAQMVGNHVKKLSDTDFFPIAIAAIPAPIQAPNLARLAPAAACNKIIPNIMIIVYK